MLNKRGIGLFFIKCFNIIKFKYYIDIDNIFFFLVFKINLVFVKRKLILVKNLRF